MDEENGTVDNTGVDESTTDTGATTDETTDSQADETTDVDESTDDSTEGDDSQQETDDDDDSDDSESDGTDAEKPKKGAEARKEQLSKEIRDMVMQRNAIRQEVAAASAQFYKPATVEQLMQTENEDTGEYYTRLEAQFEAMRQEREVEKYNNQVADSRLGLQYEASKAIEDFPEFDESSPKYDAELAKQVDKILQSSLIFDPNTNQLVGSSISPYALYQSHALAIRGNAAKAEVKARKNVQKMQNNVDKPKGTRGSTTPFDKMSLKQQEAYLRKKGHDV